MDLGIKYQGKIATTDDVEFINKLIAPVGEHLKYIVSANKRPVACLAWSSAPRHIGQHG